jgi:uncharacterized DUF497 family protein
MDVEWDRAKAERNEVERGLPFELAVLLFDGPTIERLDDRRTYGGFAFEPSAWSKV